MKKNYTFALVTIFIWASMAAACYGLFSVLISAVVLKERIKPQVLVALVLIVGGILLQNLCEGKIKQKEKAQ